MPTFGFACLVSALASSQPTVWETIGDSRTRFSVEMPSPIEASESELAGRRSREWVSKPDEQTRLSFIALGASAGSGCWLSSHARLLQEFQREMTSSAPYVWSFRPDNGYGGQEGWFRADLQLGRRIVQGRVVSHEDACYLTVAITPPTASDSIVSRFLNSFRILK